jgi:hypothetical protein
MSEFEIAIPRPRRWDEPFGEMTEADVAALLRIEPFRSMDASAFPPALPLDGILRNDTRICRYQAGDLVVREGDYGNSAFIVLAGTVRVAMERLDAQLLGRSEPARRTWRHGASADRTSTRMASALATRTAAPAYSCKTCPSC